MSSRWLRRAVAVGSGVVLGLSRPTADLGGLPLGSYAGVLVNARVADGIGARDARAWRRAGSGVVAVVVLVSLWFVWWPATTVSGHLRVAMLQGNDKDRDLSASELAARYLPASHFALAGRLGGRYDLVVFPESSLDDDPRHD